jgi:hypothetical protein
MKKLLASILTLFVLTGSAWGAAGTITYGGTEEVQWRNGQNVNRVKITYLQPGAGAGDAFLLSATDTPPSFYQGAMFYQAETDPGTAPDAGYTLAIASDKGSPILSLSALSVTASAIHDAGADLGVPPIIFDLSIDFGDLGSANDYVDLYLYFIK